jgi:hypothetical protein
MYSTCAEETLLQKEQLKRYVQGACVRWQQATASRHSGRARLPLERGRAHTDTALIGSPSGRTASG